MTLKEYLDTNGLTQAEFAQAVGVTQQAISIWLRGEQLPRRRALERIAAATKGHVRPNDFLPCAGPGEGAE